jgi:murein tripeptide amidase MpaA
MSHIREDGSSGLLTIAETSAFGQTGRTDEVERLCEAFARRWPEAVRSFEFGRSAEGRPMRALIVSRAGTAQSDRTDAPGVTREGGASTAPAAELTAAEFKRRGVPLLMFQAGIHPGESDGKDAGFIALREMLEGAAAPGALERIAILFVPAFNTDGHERFGLWNRPNQAGPRETGWRSTAHNLNLNRDYMKAESPEMQALLRLVNEWDPLVVADAHVTDGSDFEPDVSIQAEPVNQGDPRLHASAAEIRDRVIERLAAQGSLPLPFYPDLVEAEIPRQAFISRCTRRGSPRAISLSATASRYSLKRTRGRNMRPACE